MTVPFLQILAYEDTSLGTLCLRKRRLASEPDQWVTEITLNHEFLMSSWHTDSEQALARIAIERLVGQENRLLIGGLGLGYTAQAALRSSTVSSLLVMEFLPQVVEWLRSGLIPLSESLNADSRLTIQQGDVYAFLLNDPGEHRFDAILIDVDHSPDDPLDNSSGTFYTEHGLRLAARHLVPGGVLALWSYAQHTPTFQALQQVFSQVEAVPVTYFNQHVHEEFTDWLYLAQDK